MNAKTRDWIHSIGVGRFILTAFLLAALGTASAHGQGRGNGGGGGGQTGWIEQFSDGNITGRGWGIEHTGSADSLFGVPGVGMASKSFNSGNVAIDNGILSLKLTVEGSGGSFTSSGALVYTKQTYGYGLYEWCMRMSSTAPPTSPTAVSTTDFNRPPSGGVSAGFVYVNNSQTENDFEQAAALDATGVLKWWLYMANWANRRLTYTRVEATDLPGNPPPTYAEFKAYKFDWKRDYIEFFVNGSPVAFHSQNVPRNSGYVMLNHWGTNSPEGFGGPAGTGTRYFYVDWVRYTPPGGLPVSGGIACPGSSP